MFLLRNGAPLICNYDLSLHNKEFKIMGEEYLMYQDFKHLVFSYCLLFVKPQKSDFPSFQLEDETIMLWPNSQLPQNKRM